MHRVKVKRSNNFWQSTIGLIGAKNPYALCLFTRFGIHTFGVSFPLDIIIVDDTYHVMRMKKSLLPNRFYFWPPIWSIVLELPEGTIDQKHIAIGDRISLKEIN